MKKITKRQLRNVHKAAIREVWIEKGMPLFKSDVHKDLRKESSRKACRGPINKDEMTKLQCPKCGNTVTFDVEVSYAQQMDGEMKLLGEPIEPKCEENSWCQCPDCGYEGTIRDFEV